MSVNKVLGLAFGREVSDSFLPCLTKISKNFETINTLKASVIGKIVVIFDGIGTTIE